MDVEFNPERCAELHNKLLAKTYEAIPDAEQHFEQNMIARIREEIPNEAAWLLEVAEEHAASVSPEDLPSYRFFSNIKTYRPPDRPLHHCPLSAEFRQPEPVWFYPKYFEITEDERNIILLYPDNVNQPSQDGGLLLDLDTGWVTWARLEGINCVSEDPEAWVPLELALRKGLEMWDWGKFCWIGDPADCWSGLCLRSWTQRDLDETLETWGKLIQAISDRLPADTAELRDPLPADLVDEFQISPFAKSFLKAAKRPTFAYVAPGLTTFTNDSFAALMRSEAPDAPRRVYISRNLETDEYPSLILPAAPHLNPIPRDPPPPGDSFFDKPWGWGKFTIGRTAGLYTNFLREDGDTTVLVTAEGRERDQPIKFVHPRPWGNERHLTFAEMFSIWTGFIEDGIWEVGVDGVVTPHSWFTDESTKEHRRAYWSEELR